MHSKIEGDTQNIDAQRKNRDDAIAMLKLISFSESDFESGNVISSEELKNRLAQRLHKAKV